MIGPLLKVTKIGLIIALMTVASAGDVRRDDTVRTNIAIDPATGTITMTFRLLTREPVKVDLHTLQWAPAKIEAKIDVDENIVALKEDDFVEGIRGLKKLFIEEARVPPSLMKKDVSRLLTLPPGGVFAASFFCWDVPNWPKMLALAKPPKQGIVLRTSGGVDGPEGDWLKGSSNSNNDDTRISPADLKLLAAAQVAQKATPAPVPVGPHVRTRVWLDVPGGRVSIRIQSVGSTPIAVDTAMLAQIGTWVAATSAGTSIPPPKKDGYHPQAAAYLLPGEAIGVDLAPDELAIIASIDANVRAKRTVALSLPQVWTCNEQGWELITPQMDSTEAFTATALREARLHARERALEARP